MLHCSQLHFCKNAVDLYKVLLINKVCPPKLLPKKITKIEKQKSDIDSGGGEDGGGDGGSSDNGNDNRYEKYYCFCLIYGVHILISYRAFLVR